MKTEEAIKFVNKIFDDWENVYCMSAGTNIEANNKLKQVIELLQQGKKQMKQKYFPTQKTVLTLEIVSRDMENSLKEIYGFINSVNDKHITLTGIKDVKEGGEE